MSRQRTTRPFQSTFTEAPLEDQLPHPSRVLVDGLWEKFGQGASLADLPGIIGSSTASPAEAALAALCLHQGRLEVLNFLTDLAKSTPNV